MKKNQKKRKKKKEENVNLKIFIITIMIVMILILLYVLCTGIKINEKSKITNTEFVKTAQKLGFKTKNTKNEQGKEREKMLKSVTAAVKDDLKVEFYIFKTVKIAQGAFFSGEQLFSDITSANYQDNVKKGKNFSYFFINDAKRYGIVSRIDNTLVLVDTTKKNEKDVTKLMEKIGY